jgi:hypothetical protein
MDELAGHIARTEGLRNVYKILVGNIEWKIHLGRSWRRWEGNTKIDLKEKLLWACEVG